MWMIPEMKSKIFLLEYTPITIRIANTFTSNLCSFEIISYLQMSAGQPEEDEITWGSDELPIENMNSKSRDGKTEFLLYLKLDCKNITIT